MFGETSPPNEQPPLHLQVDAGQALQGEADEAALSQNAASKCHRFLVTGCGFAVLMLIGVSASALRPLASHASAKPSRLGPQIAFRPSLGLGKGGLHPAPGSARTGSTQAGLLPIAMPAVKQRQQLSAVSRARISFKPGSPESQGRLRFPASNRARYRNMTGMSIKSKKPRKEPDEPEPTEWVPVMQKNWRQKVLKLPQWNKQTWAAEWPPLIEALDDTLDRMQHAKQLNRENPVTQGVWEPQLQEHDAVPMTVSAGHLPEALAGVFLRIGPNPATGMPKNKKYHVFDGDGMIHSIRMKNGKAWYSNSFVKTKRYRVEQKLKKEYFPRLGELSGSVGLAKAVLVMGRKEAWHDMTALDSGPANTHTIYFDGDIYALAEGNFPFEMCIADDGSISSLGFTTWDRQLDFPFSAHPKVDQQNGQLVFHGYNSDPSSDGPLLKLGVKSAGTDKLDSYTPIGMSGLSFNHDMAITENYAVILDTSIRLDLMGVFDDHAMFFDEGHHLSLGLQPRSATRDETIWFKADAPMGIVHTINAFEENGEVVLQAPASLDFKTDPMTQNIFKIYEFRMTLDDPDRRIRVRELDGGRTYFNSEFPRVRDDLMGFPTRFAYTATSSGGKEHGGFDFGGLAKFDFKEMKIIGQIIFPGKQIGGDPTFIARGEDEDDGWLSVIVHDPETDVSTLNIYDAKTFDQEPVAVLDSPFRIPMGFHANFITEAQLQAHLNKHKSHDFFIVDDIEEPWTSQAQ